MNLSKSTWPAEESNFNYPSVVILNPTQISFQTVLTFPTIQNPCDHNTLLVISSYGVQRPLGTCVSKSELATRRFGLQTLTSRPLSLAQGSAASSKCNCISRVKGLQVISHCFIRWVGAGRALHNATGDRCPRSSSSTGASYFTGLDSGVVVSYRMTDMSRT